MDSVNGICVAFTGDCNIPGNATLVYDINFVGVYSGNRKWWKQNPISYKILVDRQHRVSDFLTFLNVQSYQPILLLVSLLSCALSSAILTHPFVFFDPSHTVESQQLSHRFHFMLPASSIVHHMLFPSRFPRT